MIFKHCAGGEIISYPANASTTTASWLMIRDGPSAGSRLQREIRMRPVL